jgi:methionyl-tRNA formyltransferase
MSQSPSPLRIVAFNVFPPAFEAVATWAASRGHTIVLLVTLPGGGEGRYGENPHLATLVPPGQDVLVSQRLRTTVPTVVRAMEPDLIISATFAKRIPPLVTEIPRYGALNFHPAPLPRGRGPNPQRLLYEGDLSTAVTLHRIVPEFDAGAIVSQPTRRFPEAITPEIVLGTWLDLFTDALDEGVARAIAGEYGTPQDDSRATYAAPFTPDERILDWDEPALTIQRRATALNLVGPQSLAEIDGQLVTVQDVRAVPDAPKGVPGTILHRDGETMIVRVADAAVQMTLVAETEPAHQEVVTLA